MFTQTYFEHKKRDEHLNWTVCHERTLYVYSNTEDSGMVIHHCAYEFFSSRL